MRNSVVGNLIWKRRLLHCWLPWFARYRCEAFLFCFVCLLSVGDPCINFTWYFPTSLLLILTSNIFRWFYLSLDHYSSLLLRCWFCLYVELLYSRICSLALVTTVRTSLVQNLHLAQSQNLTSSESRCFRVQNLFLFFIFLRVSFLWLFSANLTNC
jgi:hypothetical protein